MKGGSKGKLFSTFYLHVDNPIGPVKGFSLL
jgi:hypothetical protein